MALDLLKAFFPATPAGPPRSAAGGRREAVRSAKDSLEIQRKLYLETHLTNLKNRDPQFNVNGFLKHVRNTVLKVKTAFHSHDISTVWPFMTDGMHERLNVQINFRKAGG